MRQTSKCRVAGEGEAPRGGNRNALYDEVTAKIIAQLEAGRFPWVQPWGTVEGVGQGGLCARRLTGCERSDNQDENRLLGCR